MVFERLAGKKKKKKDELPPELEEFRLPGPPFRKEAPAERPGTPMPGPAREAPPSRPFIPPEFGGERFPSRPEPKKEETDRIAVILNKLDIIDARLKIIEEKLK